MTQPYLIPLSEAADLPAQAANDLVGGKAINLARMMKAGLPVPDGFVITTAAFKGSGDGTVSDTLTQIINVAYESLGANLVAVRSSATAEDMDGASMAGQYETFLNLMNLPELIDGIEKCWASLRSDRILAYLKERGIPPEMVSMAVVVQKLVTADVAGVLFTTDPKTGYADEMIIEATWGLGDTLVSGEVQPDVVRVSAHQERVLAYEVATKKHILHPGSKDLFPVKEEDQDRACLQYEHILELRKLGQQAEAYFGGPQDIEWAIEANDVLMLQSRPITTLAETVALNELTLGTRTELKRLVDQSQGPWVRHNLGETLSNPTPFTWKLLSHFMSGEGGYGKMHTDLGFMPSAKVMNGQSFLKKIGSEIYMDCSLMTEMFAEDYPYAYDPALLRKDPDAAQRSPTIQSGSLTQLGVANKLAMDVAANIKALAEDLDKTFDNVFVKEVTEWCQVQSETDLSALTRKELIECWHDQSHKVLDEFGPMAFLPSMVESLAVEELDMFLQEHVWDEEPETLLTLFTISEEPDCTIKGNIALKYVASGQKDLADWLDIYGHRAPGEFELMTPRWQERPEDVRHMAELMVGSTDIEHVHEQRLHEAEDCLEKMKTVLSADQFEMLTKHVSLVQRYCRFREDGKFQLMRAYSQLRHTALEIGHRLEIDEDVFYLEPEEALKALRTGFVPKDLIAERKVAHKVKVRLQLPHVIDVTDIDTLGEAIVHADGPSMKAHSVSNGVATGPAVTIFDPTEVEELEKGSILVCPSTDPSWTPLFASAAGLVLERGGSLSHGAVVAREMGLPAVVLEGATESFKPGEKITIDANRGLVFREGAEIEADPATDTNIPRKISPPPVSQQERNINQLGLVFTLGWCALLAIVFLLPPAWLHDPIMGTLDALIWPLIRAFGMAGAVAIIATIFGVLPIVGQKYLTDNERLNEAKRRSASLRKDANLLDPGSPRRKAMEKLAGPTTTRLLKAAMVPLALILGPMIMVFMWFPARVDPASWAAAPGRMVSIVAEVDGECQDAISLNLSEALTLDSGTPAKRQLPPIRQELEDLRREWQSASDMTNLPWEVRSAGDHARLSMVASLNSYLRQGIPPQKITWMIHVPEKADGRFDADILIGVSDTDGKQKRTLVPMVFGQSAPPPLAMIEPAHPDLISVTVNYPRPLQKLSFWTPLAGIGGPSWDFGWLGVYLLAYLPVMFIAKFFLRVP